ncbi:MAG: hypothetical protein WDA04_07860 [Anaerolineaceae bacterium]|jgi:hypothetical protein
MPVISAFRSAESGVRGVCDDFWLDFVNFELRGVLVVRLAEVERLVRGFAAVLVLLER